MKKRIIYIVCLLALFLLLYWNNKNTPVEFVWRPTYNIDDKQPYGASAMDELLKASWEKGYTHTYQSIADLSEDESLDTSNLLIIANYFSLSDNELDTLLSFVKNGGTALIIARYYSDKLSDSLNFSTDYDALSDLSDNLSTKQRMNTLRFSAPDNYTKSYQIPVSISSGYFDCNYKNKAGKDSVFKVSECDTGKIVTLRYQIGKGNLLLSCNPKIFTNYGILDSSFNQYIWNTFSYLQNKPLIRTEYYQVGSQYGKSRSPLRYLLSVRALKWALYRALLTIVVFMIFTAKRKQKAIPVVKPPENKMLDFVRSIAALYIRKNNNADLILKKYVYWADNLKRNYGIDIVNDTHDSEFFERLASKTGKTVEEVSALFKNLDAINEDTNVPDSQMIELITKINSYGKF
jgi:hypothetical protein